MNKQPLTLKQSAYLLPNLMTAFNLICGLLAIMIAMEALGSADKDKFSISAWLIIAAMVFDFLDGKVARLTHTESTFGVKIDSLTDFVSFGVAPMVLAYRAFLSELALMYQVTPIIVFLFAGAWRLARFNCETPECHTGTHFLGLPIPAAASFICATVLVNQGPAYSIAPKIIGRSFAAISPTTFNLAAVLLIVGLSILMVSHIPFPAFKKVNRRNLFF